MTPQVLKGLSAQLAGVVATKLDGEEVVLPLVITVMVALWVTDFAVRGLRLRRLRPSESLGVAACQAPGPAHRLRLEGHEPFESRRFHRIGNSCRVVPLAHRRLAIQWRPVRQQRGENLEEAEELIRRALSEILIRGDLHDPVLSSTPVTVGEVRCSPDLRHATVFVLPLGGVNTAEVMEALERHRAELRRLVTGVVQLKYSPELKFVADQVFDQMDETRRLLGTDEVQRDLDEQD